MHRDLLEQARTLATLDSGKPKQANLRRAVSAAYYAIFHYLVDQSCRAIMGAHHAQRGYRQALARGFVHSTMKAACASFAGSQLPKAVAKPLPNTFAVDREIRAIATTFSELQQKRYLADYDLSERFKRSEVLTLIEQVEDELDQFDRVSASDGRQFFLACLLAWKEIANR